MSDQSNPLILVLITAPSKEIATNLAQGLLEEKLAACVNIVSEISSLYWWEGQIQADTEVLLLVKTRQQGFQERLIPFIQKHHPYQVPEILALPILDGNQAYLDWMLKETSLQSKSSQGGTFEEQL